MAQNRLKAELFSDDKENLVDAAWSFGLLAALVIITFILAF